MAATAPRFRSFYPFEFSGYIHVYIGRVQRSEEGHWVEEEYFQESKNLLEKVEEDLYQGTFNIWQLWIERRHLTVSYIGEATVPVSVVQCQYGG